MRGGKLGIAIVLVASFAFFSSDAHAGSGAALVAIVTAEPNAPLARRVAAELQGIGVDVIVIKPPAEGSASRAPLEQAARNVGAIAAVRLVTSSGGMVEVWVADRVTGKAVVRELDGSGKGASDATVALGAVELLRASLMELHSAEPPHGDVPATDTVLALALPSTDTGAGIPRLGLAIGAGAELGVRGLGPSPDASIAVWARVAPRLGVRLFGQLSLSPAQVQTSSGSVDAESQLFGAMVRYAFAEEESTWVPSISLGGAAAHLATTGTAVAPYVSGSAASWFAAPAASVGLAWSFTHALRLYGEGLVAWTIPGAVVSTPTSTAGHWGEPLVMMTVAVEMLWGH